MNGEQRMADLLAAHRAYMLQLQAAGEFVGNAEVARAMLQHAIDRSTESIFWATHGMQAAPERRILSDLHG